MQNMQITSKQKTLFTCKNGVGHHFHLPSPDGPTSEGVCIYCGVKQDFLNVVDLDRAHRNTYVAETRDPSDWGSEWHGRGLTL